MNVSEVVITSCQKIAMNATKILHVFTGSSYEILFGETQGICSRLSLINKDNISNYNTQNIMAETTVALHSHLEHLLSQVHLSQTAPHKIHDVHRVLSQQYENLVSAFDAYMLANKAVEKEQPVYDAIKSTIATLENEMKVVTPVHPLSARPWEGNRLRAIELLKTDDFRAYVPLLMSWDFPSDEVLQLVDALNETVKEDSAESVQQSRDDLLEALKRHGATDVPRFQEDDQRSNTVRMLSVALGKFEKMYWRFKDRRDIGAAMKALEETLVPTDYEDYIAISELKEIGECLRYGTVNALYLMPEYGKVLRYLGAPDAQIKDAEAILNVSSYEELEAVRTSLPAIPTYDAYLSLVEVVHELLVLDALITSTEYHQEQFEYLSTHITNSTTKITRSAMFLAYLVRDPTQRECALLAAASIKQAITDIALFLNELTIIKARDERDWVVKQDIAKFICSTQILQFYTRPPTFFRAHELAEEMVAKAQNIAVFRAAGIANRIEFDIRDAYKQFRVAVTNMNSETLSVDMLDDLQRAVDNLDAAEITRIGTEVAKTLRKHRNADAVNNYIHVVSLCAVTSHKSLFEKVFSEVKEEMKVFSLDEQFLFKRLLDTCMARAAGAIEAAQDPEDIFEVEMDIRKALDNCFIVDESAPSEAIVRDIRAVICAVIKEASHYRIPDIVVKKLYERMENAKSFVHEASWIDAIGSELEALFSIFSDNRDVKRRIFYTLFCLEGALNFLLSCEVRGCEVDDVKKIVSQYLVYIKWGFDDCESYVRQLTERFGN